MIRRFLAIAALAIPALLGAQTDTATTSFEINGLRVILRRNAANDVVAASVYLLGGTQQLSPATQGMETLLLEATERGTKKYPGALVRQRAAALGTTIVIAPNDDWTRFGFTTVRANFDSAWSILADRLMAPTLDSLEVELVRARMIDGFRQAENDPDPLVNRLADSLTYINHPYGFSPAGTETSLGSITLAALRNYQSSQMVTSRMLLVVVGNIERARLEQLVGTTLAQLPHGTYSWSAPRAVPKLGKALVMREANLPTNYLIGYYPGPAAKDSDYQALRVASAVLSGRFFTEIRSRKNLSYEVDAPFLERAVSTGGIYVTTTNPNATLQIMRAEIDRLQRELIDPQGLDRLTQQFITDYYLKNETNADQATMLARAQIYQGDYRAANRFAADLRRVTPEAVRRVARQYIRDFRFVYLGRPDALSRALIDQF
jgi:zinc protease